MAVALMNDWVVLMLAFAWQLHHKFVGVIIKNNIQIGDFSN